MSAAWFSSVRTPTKRIEGLVTASQIPAASAASFFCLRSRVEEERGDAYKRVPFPLPPHQTGRAVVFPTVFIIRHTTATLDARDLVAAHRVPRRHARGGTVSCRDL